MMDLFAATTQAKELLDFLQLFKENAPLELFPEDPWRTILEREAILRRLLEAARENPRAADALVEEVEFWCDLLAWKPAIRRGVVIPEWR